MRRVKVTKFLVALWAVGAVLTTARADAQARDDLRDAEQAFQQIDFEATRAAAQRALDAGGHTLAQTARIYYLLGLAHAATGSESRSRDAYIRYIALDPESRTDRSLSPQLRAPLLEARGYWSSQSQRFTMTERFVRESSSLEMTVSDPASMATSIVVRFRVAGEAAFREVVRPSGDSVTIALEGAVTAGADYVVQLVDNHRNVLITRGMEGSPLHVSASSATGGASTGPSSSGGMSATTAVGIASLSVGGIGLIVGGVGFGLRESNVQQYNDDRSCQPEDNRTRDQACGALRSAFESWGTIGTVSMVAGGLLAVTGIILVALPRGAAPPATERTTASRTRALCVPTLNLPGVSCAFQF